MSEHMIETRVGRLRVEVIGDRGPTALLWHSLFVDERSWDRMLPRLVARRRLVVVTGPGHGVSTDPGRRYTLDDCAEAAVQVLDALSVREPVDWVGNAWGGHVGLLFAAEWPERCLKRGRVRHPDRRVEPRRAETDPALDGSVSAAWSIADDRERNDRGAAVAAHDRARPGCRGPRP